MKLRVNITQFSSVFSCFFCEVQYFPQLPIPTGSGIAQWYNARLRAGWSGSSSAGRGWEFFTSLPYPDRLWNPPSLLSIEYHGPFPCG